MNNSDIGADNAEMTPRVYYGWWIVAGLFFVLTISSGFGFYNLSVYMNVLADTRGFAIADVSIAVSLFFVAGGVTGMWVASLIRRFDLRWVMVGGAALGGSALALIGHVTELWQLYLVYALFGIGNSGVSIVVATTLVTRWFPGPNRSVALSIASTGLSMGGVLITPLSAWLLNRWGMETTIPWFGFAFFVLIVPIALWLIRAGPEAESKQLTGVGPREIWRYREAIRSRFFVRLTAGYVLCMGAQVGGIAHLYNHADTLSGFEVAATAIQALTIMSIVSRFMGGWIVTRVTIRGFTLANLLNQSLGLLIIALADDVTLVLIGAAVFGSSIGNLLMLHPLWLAEAFGIHDYPRIFSLSNAVMVLGVAAGPVLLGVLYDAFDYWMAYFAAMGVSLVAFAVVYSAGKIPETNVDL
ncbi:MAG: MFS transporter [Gammaproteobacteria bacterium]|nr:MFS transporter [Gammaproteobacteria bacterium]